jgi:signal transduction histidine kinase
VLEREIAAIGSVAGPIAHDFNNIFAAISGSVTLLEIGSPADAPRHLANIQKASQRGVRILRQLQSLSPRADSEMHIVDPQPPIEDACARIRDSLTASQRLTCTIASPLPPTRIDSTQLKQLLLVLGDNAREATAQGGEILVSAGRCHIDANEAASLGASARTGDFLAVKVEDTGTGIPAEILPRIFEPFFSTKSKTRDSGTGLGLTIALRITLRHEGFLTAESEPGAKTTVTAYFPL